MQQPWCNLGSINFTIWEWSCQFCPPDGFFTTKRGPPRRRKALPGRCTRNTQDLVLVETAPRSTLIWGSSDADAAAPSRRKTGHPFEGWPCLNLLNLPAIFPCWTHFIPAPRAGQACKIRKEAPPVRAAKFNREAKTSQSYQQTLTDRPTVRGLKKGYETTVAIVG